MKISFSIIRNSEGDRSGLQVDVVYTISCLVRLFPSIHFEEEYFLKQIGVIENLSKKQEMSNALKIAIRDAEERGPGYKFTIDIENGSCMRGGINRYYLGFEFEGDVPSKEKQKVESFVKSFDIDIDICE